MTDLDLDAIEREARAYFKGGHSFVDPGKILALVAEVRALRATQAAPDLEPFDQRRHIKEFLESQKRKR